MSDIKAFIRMLLQIARRMDYIVLYLSYRCVKKIRNNYIIMLSDSREILSGNLLFIDEKIPKDKYDVEYFFKKSLRQKKSFREKRELCKAMASAKFILLDDFYPLIYPIPLSKKTKLIQVWHAMGAFKRVGFSRMGKVGGPKKYSLTHRNYTDAIVSSEAIRENYAEAFHMPVEHVHAIGVPRTDIFFDDGYRNKIREQFETAYPQIENKKVILFAPTFRGNGQNTAHYPYEWMPFEQMQAELGDEYVCIFKPHPFVHNKPEYKLDSDFYIDCSDYREINDLLFITDVLVTDYSSVIFEASLLSVKTLFFVPDLEEYMEGRDFYYPFEDYLYGKAVYAKEELTDAIRTAAISEEKLARFREKFCSACDGHSSERFVKVLLEIK